MISFEQARKNAGVETTDEGWQDDEDYLLSPEQPEGLIDDRILLVSKRTGKPRWGSYIYLQDKIIRMTKTGSPS